MTATDWFEASGEGVTEITDGSYQFVNFVLAHVGALTSPRVRLLGTTTPRRIMYGGSCAFGGTDTNQDGADVFELGLLHNFQYEAEFWPIPAASQGRLAATHFSWHLPDGITWWLKVVIG